MACRFLGILMIASASSSVQTIFPPLQEVHLEGSSQIQVSSNFEVEFTCMEEEWCVNVQRVISPGIYRLRESTTTESGISRLSIMCHTAFDPSAYPSIRTDESYQISWTPESITVSARSISGLVYSLSTLAQYMYISGSLPSNSGEISDYPKHVHRGLLVDTGRRFWPMSLLEQTIEAMSAVKLNVLHFHFSDNCRFAIESDTHPELLPSDGQYLTKSQVKHMIDLAAKRGIRVIPEIDLPGHARGMRNALGVTWSNSDRVQMTDSQGTRDFLYDILNEFAALFVDEYFHIGADETQNAPKALIEFAVDILQSRGKKVIGWEEMIFVSEAKNDVVQLWKDFKIDDADDLGVKSIYSHYQSLYLDLRPENKKLWLNINKGKSTNVLGAEVAMWTDNFCPIGDCYVKERPIPVAGKFYDAEKNYEFIEAINRLIWTKTGIAASSFWNFKGDLDQFDLIWLKKFLYSNFGIKGCIDSKICRCGELSNCASDDFFLSLPRYETMHVFESLDGDADAVLELVSDSVDGTVYVSSEPVASTDYIGSLIVPLSYPVVMFPPEEAALSESGRDMTQHIALSEREISQHISLVDFFGGIYLTKYASYLGSRTLIRNKQGEPLRITGDLSIYYVDGFYSAPAFSSDNIPGLESFVADIRNSIAGTIFFVYDDGGKHDPVLLFEYCQKFVHSSLNVDGVGIGINIEDLTRAQLNPIIDSLNVQLQIITYDEPASNIVEMILKKAHSFLVHIPGKTVNSIVSNVIAFLNQYKLHLQGEAKAYLTFAVASMELLEIEVSVRNAIETIFGNERMPIFDKLLMVHPWEKVLAAP